MTTEDFLNLFAEGLNVPRDQITLDLAYSEIDEWDSIGHMSVIAMIEEHTGQPFETDDIIAIDSVKKAIEISRKYGLEVS